MSDRSFHELVAVLTTEHHGWVETDQGKALKLSDGLLTRLREAVFGGMENTGGGASFGSKPPMDVSAQDALNEIDQQAAQALASVDSRPTPYGTTEKYVSLWAAATQPDTIVTVTARATNKFGEVYDEYIQCTALGLVSRWVNRIESFFQPPKPRPVNEPCPKCGERYLETIRDGQTVRNAVLNFYADRETNETIEARCSNPDCGATWSPRDFEFLAVAVGAVKAGESWNEVVARHAAEG